MDRALLERMVGAVVLVLLFVVFVPALLDGRQDDAGETSDNSTARTGIRTEVIVLNAAETAPPSVAESPKPLPATPKKTVAAPPKKTVAPPPAQPKKTVAPPAKTTPTKAPKAQPVATAKPKRQVPREGFAVQLGSFSSRDNAMAFAAKVEAADYPVFVIRAAANGGAVYRVCAGPRPTREAADKLAAKLAAEGQSVMVFDLGGLGSG
jgi:DedD protein